MDNVLDILVDYSQKRRFADNEYIRKVLHRAIVCKDLSEYARSICFTKITKDQVCTSEEGSPMAYNPFKRKILIDNAASNYYKDFYDLSSDFLEIERFFLVNGLITQGLLHETEHVNQMRKSGIFDNDLEKRILSICYYGVNEFFKESKVAQFLMLTKGIYLNKNLHCILGAQQVISSSFGMKAPEERMANIISMQEVLEMIKQIDKIYGIPNLKCFLSRTLADFQIEGYNNTNGIIISPLESYLAFLSRFTIPSIDEHLNREFSTLLADAQNAPLERRLLLGTSISLDEYQAIQKKI